MNTVATYLDAHGVSYELVDHAPAYTAAAEAAAADVDSAAGGKTLLLRDRDAYRVVVLPTHRHLDLHRVRDLLRATRHLRLATEAEMAHDFPLYEVGAVPPIGPTVPSPDIVDVRLLDSERAVFAAGDHRHSVVIPVKDLVRAAEPRVADVCTVRDDIEDW